MSRPSRIFVYEYLTGGGLLGAGSSQSALQALRSEGLAMFEAISRDLAALNDTHLIGLWDGRLGNIPEGMPVDLQAVWTESEHQASYSAMAGAADAALVIAPESDGQLHIATRRIVEAGGCLLGPSPEIVRLCSNKTQLVRHLAKHGIPVPPGVRLEIDGEIPREVLYPAILKPDDGAGSQFTRLVCGTEEAAQHRPRMQMRLEAFHPGTPVSVAILCGPESKVALPACCQRIEIHQRSVYYQGGALPLSQGLSERATRLAERAVDSLPSPLGFLGVDLMLGDDPAGSEDVVLEINPRLTTSYVGLRAALDINVAELMLDVIAGESPELYLDPRAVEFSAEGRVRTAEVSAMDRIAPSTNESPVEPEHT